jgi:hypothetical protein
VCSVSFLSGGLEIWKGSWLQLMGCAPDVLLVLSIFGESENQNNVGEDLVERSELKSEIWRSEDTGSEVRDVGTSEEALDKRRTRVSSLH